MILRRSLFLDTDAVRDYLGQLEGVVVAGEVIQTDTATRECGGRLGYGPLGANAASGGATETKQTLVVNEAALFQRLHDLLVDQDQVQVLGAFDPNSWAEFKKGEGFEVEATIRVPAM